MLNILGMGCAHPTTVLDNKFLEDLDVGTNAKWIEDKIGVLTRVTTLPIDYIKTTRNQDLRMAKEVASMSSTDLGVKAAHMALQRAGLQPSDVGMIICNCCVPNFSAPSEAQRIARALDIDPVAFDVFTACPAYALQLDYLRNYQEDRLPDVILCVSTATMTHHVNYNDRSDGAIWGDGAAAWLVSPRLKGRMEIVDSSFAADPTRGEAVIAETFGYFKQDGRAVRDFSVRQTVRLVKAMEEKYSIDWTQDIFVGHQANRTMLEQVVNNREIPARNHWHNVTYLGNQAGAGAPATMAMNWDRFQPGQRVVSAVVGAGLSWGSLVLRVL